MNSNPNESVDEVRMQLIEHRAQLRHLAMLQKLLALAVACLAIAVALLSFFA